MSSSWTLFDRQNQVARWPLTCALSILRSVCRCKYPTGTVMIDKKECGGFSFVLKIESSVKGLLTLQQCSGQHFRVRQSSHFISISFKSVLNLYGFGLLSKYIWLFSITDRLKTVLYCCWDSGWGTLTYSSTSGIGYTGTGSLFLDPTFKDDSIGEGGTGTTRTGSTLLDYRDVTEVGLICLSLI